jgi:hypothetical protein
MGKNRRFVKMKKAITLSLAISLLFTHHAVGQVTTNAERQSSQSASHLNFVQVPQLGVPPLTLEKLGKSGPPQSQISSYHIGKIQIGRALKGQYERHQTTGILADNGAFIAEIPASAKGIKWARMTRDQDGIYLTRSFTSRVMKRSIDGKPRSSAIVNGLVSGVDALTVRFSQDQAMVGLSINDLGATEQIRHVAGQRRDVKSLRIKAFREDGTMIEELRYEIQGTMSFYILRCQLKSDIRAIQLTHSVSTGISITEVAYDPNPIQNAEELRDFIAAGKADSVIRYPDCAGLLG